MKFVPGKNPSITLFAGYLLPLLVLGVISRTFTITSSLYYIVPVLLITCVLIFLILIPRVNKKIFYFLIIMPFPVYCAFTSLWSLTPYISILRALYLLLLYAGLYSSVMIYRYFFNNKSGFGFLLPANIIIVVLSLYSLVTGIPSNSWTAGNSLGFMGFSAHQNTLAAALLFTMPGLLGYKIKDLFKIKEKSKKIKDLGYRVSFEWIFYFLLLIFNFFLVFITYSRAAIVSMAFGMIAFLIFNKSKKIILFLFLIFTLVIVLYSAVPFIQNSINPVLFKNSGRLLDRRTVLWQPSIEAAKMGGLFGLGYGVSAPGIKTPLLTGSRYQDGRYIREKGNSVLALIEETGFVGLFLFILPVFWILIKFITDNLQFRFNGNYKSNSVLYTYLPVQRVVYCTLIAMIIHAQFEAWWVGIGSISLPLFLIFLFFAFPSDNILITNKENN